MTLFFVLVIIPIAFSSGCILVEIYKDFPSNSKVDYRRIQELERELGFVPLDDEICRFSAAEAAIRDFAVNELSLNLPGIAPMPEAPYPAGYDGSWSTIDSWLAIDQPQPILLGNFMPVTLQQQKGICNG